MTTQEWVDKHGNVTYTEDTYTGPCRRCGGTGLVYSRGEDGDNFGPEECGCMDWMIEVDQMILEEKPIQDLEQDILAIERDLAAKKEELEKAQQQLNAAHPIPVMISKLVTESVNNAFDGRMTDPAGAEIRAVYKVLKALNRLDLWETAKAYALHKNPNAPRHLVDFTNWEKY